MRLLVDTNIFLDYLLQRDDNCKHALRFFIWCRQNRNQTFVTSISLRDIEYFVMKHVHDKAKTNRILSETYGLCSKVIGVSADAAINAIYEDYKDFEDELMIQAAKEELLDAVITNNVKDFKDRGVPVFTPEEIVSLNA